MFCRVAGLTIGNLSREDSRLLATWNMVWGPPECGPVSTGGQTRTLAAKICSLLRARASEATFLLVCQQRTPSSPQKQGHLPRRRSGFPAREIHESLT